MFLSVIGKTANSESMKVTTSSDIWSSPICRLPVSRIAATRTRYIMSVRINRVIKVSSTSLSVRICGHIYNMFPRIPGLICGGTEEVLQFADKCDIIKMKMIIIIDFTKGLE